MTIEFAEKSQLGCEMATQERDIWAEYASGGNLMLHNVVGISRRMREKSSKSAKLFSDEERMAVDILDITKPTNATSSRLCQKTVRNVQDLNNHLSTSGVPDTRFISISAPGSVKPLKITDVGMNMILKHHDVGPQFLDLLLSFATGGKESEAGPGSMVVKHHPDRSYEMQYRYSYVEEIVGSTTTWAIRQTGIYHRHIPNGPGGLWIFLHPRPNSTLQRRLEEAVTLWDQTKDRREEWEDVHFLVFSSYFGDWRWYLRSLSAEIERIASLALSIDFSKEDRSGRDIDILQNLHSLQDKVLPLSPRLRSTLSTITSLKAYYQTLYRRGSYEEAKAVDIADELQAYDVFLNGHIASVALLEKRVQEILNLLGVALNLKNQATTVTINRGIWNLTKDTVDDSATVRLVTIVTLVYLPASFVASFLGMNLFSFQTADGTGFQISQKFWIFVIMAVPMTLITVGSWIYMARGRKKQRQRERQMQALAIGEKEEV